MIMLGMRMQAHERERQNHGFHGNPQLLCVVFYTLLTQNVGQDYLVIKIALQADKSGCPPSSSTGSPPSPPVLRNPRQETAQPGPDL